MRKDFGAKAILYPMPVLIIGTYNDDGTPNAMNAAWGGISEENEISVTVASGHKTADNLIKTKAFTVSIPDTDNLLAADYVGIVSGKTEPDKVKKCGWTVNKSPNVNAPVINELMLTLECKVISYDTATDKLIGEIVNVSADEKILTDGKIDLTKFSPLTFDPANCEYIQLGKSVGKAFSDGKNLKTLDK